MIRGSGGWRRVLGAMALALAIAPGAAAAQGLFDPAVRINDRIITNFELDQRTLFLTLLNAGPNPRDLARNQLISERLQLDAAAAAGIDVPEQAIISAQEEFAARGEFTREELIEALADQGVEEGTFRDFLRSGLVWREVVRAQFGPRAQVTDDQVDRALATIPSQGGTRILVSEIFLPAGTPQTEAASRGRAERLVTLTDEDAFSAAARRFSVAASRFQGGQVDWRPLEALPPEAAAQITQLQPGQVTRPVLIGERLALFQLRDREDVAAGSVEIVSADYAEFLIPGGRSREALAEAARVRRDVDSCADLNQVALGLPEDRLTRQTIRLTDLPADVAREIEGLDDNEISTALTRGGNLVVLMLCGRTVRESGAVDRDLARRFLVNQRLETFASGFLNELRTAAEIEILE